MASRSPIGPTPPAPQDDEGGLAEDEAARRLAADGPNRLALPPSRELRAIALGVVRQPMFMLLLATAVVYGLVGEAAEAAVMLVSVAVVAGISLFQEYRTERVLDSLRQLSSPRSRVVRGGEMRLIPSQELVRDDRLLVGEGDRMACDAVVLQSHGLLVDESLLTGESAPVLKRDRREETPLAEHRLHAGTLVVAGDGVAIVDATGGRTTLGRIGSALASIEQRPSRVQAELRQVVTRVALFAVLASAAAALLYALREASWVQGLIAGLTLAMAIIPEEFAVVWSVMLALGAWRLARVGVLTRQGQAIEALGTTTVLCVDKTGTLTHNRMELVRLVLPDRELHVSAESDVDPAARPLLETAARASVAQGLEPMDRAVLRLYERLGGAGSDPMVLVGREGVASGRPYVSARWRQREGTYDLRAMKGAPEALLPRCGMEPQRRQQLLHEAERLAAEGLRVLAVVRGDGDGPHDAADTAPLRFVGLLGFLDPVREDVPAAMAQCRQAGMRVVMITGDAPATAAAIARMAGLESAAAPAAAPAVLQGTQLEAMSDAELDQAVAATSIFARVSPEQKLRIVRALQRRGEVVAMTGDGVNDASALRAADIGVAMGRRGTDVAREAAALVLLEDSFAAMVEAVRMGRRIFGNLHNAVGYLIAVHVPIVGVSLLPVLFGGPALLLPLHVVLLELIIDPACSLVFEAEPEPEDCMRRPPRPPGVRLLSASAARRAMVIGGLALVFAGGSVAMARAMDLGPAWMRLVALVALVAGNLFMLLWYLRGARAGSVRRGNAALRWLLAGVAAALALIGLGAAVVPQLGLPDHPALRMAGLAFGAAAAAAAARLLRNRHKTGGKPRHATETP